LRAGLFRTSREHISKLTIRLELKKFTGFRQKSEFLFIRVLLIKGLSHDLFVCADLVLGVVTLGPDSESTGRLHWMRALANPGERAYLTHTIYLPPSYQPESGY
jgi:hypothetical protein